MDTPESKNKTYWNLIKATLGQNKTQSTPRNIANGITHSIASNRNVNSRLCALGTTYLGGGGGVTLL